MENKAKALSLPGSVIVPNHIAIILDGNRRWARSKGLAPWEGHKAGYKAVRKLARAAREFGVHTFTIWAFSTENWERPKEEIEEIFELLRVGIGEFEKEAHKEKVRLVHIGRKDRFPKDIARMIERVEKSTLKYDDHILNLALDYGGRDEILRAVKKIIKDKIPAENINEELLSSYLDTSNQPYPYPDLFIRTSGEQRTSGLFPWQMVYTEFYWELDYLPDFTPFKLREAILDYSRRRRRFGGNDKVEHLKFNPRVVAKLELDWRRAFAIGDGIRFRDLVAKYLKEHYGLSKELAKKAGYNLAQALAHGKSENWDEAREALKGLYEIISKTLGLAMEPGIIASLEIQAWQSNGSPEKSDNRHFEDIVRRLYAETFRLSELQVRKAAHLAVLATHERDLAESKTGKEAEFHWKKARIYLEQFYVALKERVA